MLGLILYLILVVFLFVITWAGIGSLSLRLKELIAKVDEMEKKIQNDAGHIKIFMDETRETFSTISNNESKTVDIINDSLNNIESRFASIEGQIFDLSNIESKEFCHLPPEITCQVESLVTPEKEKPKKKRKSKKKTEAETPVVEEVKAE